MRTCVENSTRFHYFLKYFMSNSALLKIIFYPLSLESSSPSSCPQQISLKKKKSPNVSKTQPTHIYVSQQLLAVGFQPLLSASPH